MTKTMVVFVLMLVIFEGLFAINFQQDMVGPFS
jgi:hypothetical protein